MPMYKFKPGVLESFRTGAVALRVGDSNAAKTGFNHGGGQIVIESIDTGSTINYLNMLNKSSELEASRATIKVIFEDGATSTIVGATTGI